MTQSDQNILIIGGGAAGIAVGKAFTQRSIPFEIVEREDDFGGNWYYGSAASRMYQSTHLISSKTNTQFSDFLFPEDYPEYPSHAQFLDYLRSAASHFDLYSHTTFRVSVDHMTPEQNGWRVNFSDGKAKWYPDVVVANGILRKPYLPEIPGEFSNEIIHSSSYAEPDILEGKSVLVVGGGNSGCDIAVDSAYRARSTFHSTRRGYHYIPKFIDGRPAQDWMMETVSQFDTPEAYWSHVKHTIKLAGNDGEDYGLPAPDHGINEAHPIMNSSLLYQIGHGNIVPKPNLTCFDGTGVVFEDGSREEIDLVILATGFQIDLPFLDPSVIDWQAGLNNLFLNAIPLNYDNIVFIGYFNLPSGFGNIANLSSRLVANYFINKRKKSSAWLVMNELKQMRDKIDIGQKQFIATRRHKHELDLWKFIKTVNFLNQQLELNR